MTKDHSIDRETAVKLMRKGLITISEAAREAGVSRQLAAYWAKAAGIDPNEARWQYLRKLAAKGGIKLPKVRPSQPEK